MFDPEKIMAQIERWLRAGWVALIILFVCVQIIRHFYAV